MTSPPGMSLTGGLEAKYIPVAKVRYSLGGDISQREKKSILWERAWNIKLKVPFLNIFTKIPLLLLLLLLSLLLWLFLVQGEKSYLKQKALSTLFKEPYGSWRPLAWRTEMVDHNLAGISLFWNQSEFQFLSRAEKKNSTYSLFSYKRTVCARWSMHSVSKYWFMSSQCTWGTGCHALIHDYRCSFHTCKKRWYIKLYVWSLFIVFDYECLNMEADYRSSHLSLFYVWRSRVNIYLSGTVTLFFCLDNHSLFRF